MGITATQIRTASTALPVISSSTSVKSGKMFVETKPRADIPNGYKIILSRIRMEKKTKKGVDKNAVLMYNKTNVR